MAHVVNSGHHSMSSMEWQRQHLRQVVNVETAHVEKFLPGRVPAERMENREKLE